MCSINLSSLNDQVVWQSNVELSAQGLNIRQGFNDRRHVTSTIVHVPHILLIKCQSCKVASRDGGSFLEKWFRFFEFLRSEILHRSLVEG